MTENEMTKASATEAGGAGLAAPAGSVFGALEIQDSYRDIALEFEAEETGRLEYEVCPTCDGEGEIMDCWDDVCQGIGECIHGDGYRICPDCNGNG